MDGSNEAMPGWWLASDGRWYRPEDLPIGWQIGDGGVPLRSPAPAVPPVLPMVARDVVPPAVPPSIPPAIADAALPVARSFTVATASIGVSADDLSRVQLVLRRWWPVGPAFVVIALVLAYVFMSGGDGDGSTRVLGRVEDRSTTTAADAGRKIATKAPSSLGSASAATADPAKLTAGALGVKVTTATLSLLPGRAGPFATTTTTLPRSGPVPTTTTTTVAGPVTPRVPGAPTTQPPTTSVPGSPTTTVGGSTSSTPPLPTTASTTTRPPPPTTRPPATTTTSPPTTTTTTTTTSPTTTTTTTTSPPPTTTVLPAICSASVSDSTPRDRQSITVNVVSSLRGAPVVLTIRYRSGPTTRHGTTSGSGLSVINFNIGNQPDGFLVVVDVTVGGAATCQTSFRPH